MSEQTAAFAPSVAAAYDFSGMRVIADIGGGQSTLLAAILRRHRQLRGILFDVADVARRAGSVLRDAGVAGRCEIIAGDFFTGVPKGADGYMLANVLHDWDDDNAVRILQACRHAMGPGGRVLIAERLIPDNPYDAVPVLLTHLPHSTASRTRSYIRSSLRSGHTSARTGPGGAQGRSAPEAGHTEPGLGLPARASVRPAHLTATDPLLPDLRDALTLIKWLGGAHQF
jgi:hypothetical protein